MDELIPKKKSLFLVLRFSVKNFNRLPPFAVFFAIF